MEALIKSRYAECDQRTGNLRKCVRSEETCPQGAPEAYLRTLEEPLGLRFAGDDVFSQRFHYISKSGARFTRKGERASDLRRIFWYLSKNVI